MEKLESKIGYRFGSKILLKEAMTHSSYANENPQEGLCNERMEFLGDSVLSIVVSEYLYKQHKNIPEGELTKERAALVCEGSLYGFAKKISLDNHIRLGKGERMTSGGDRPSILSDAFEALIAAIYLDGGFDEAKKFVLGFVERVPEENENKRDYKTELQEIVQKNPEERLRYVVTNESGPDHEKTFTVDVMLNSNKIGSGVGRNKKAAEQSAAKEALELMGL